MSGNAIRDIQSALVSMNYDPSSIDGVWGPKTLSALNSLIAASRKPAVNDLPWMTEAKGSWAGTKRDNARLSMWLRSDGPFLEDPARLP